MSNKNVLCTVHSKVNPFLQVLLLFNFSTSKSHLLIFFVIFTKYFGLSILSSNYILNIDKTTVSNVIISQIIREGTIFYYFRNFSPPIYFSVCIFIYILIIALLLYCLKYAIYIKRHKANITLELFPKIMFYFLLIFGQHVLELLSLICIIVFKQKLKLPTSEIYYLYKTYGLLTDTIDYTIAVCVFGIMNIIIYILVNIMMFFCYYLINNPFHCVEAPLSLRHKQYSFYLVVLMNLFSLHYWEIFLEGISLIVYQNIMLAITLIIIIGQIMFNIYNYERKNAAYFFMEFVGIYDLISILIEIFISVFGIQYSIMELLMSLILKIILSAILIMYENYYQAKYFAYLSKTYLFEPFDPSKVHKTLESFYFLLDQLIGLKQNKSAHVLIDIISTHKNKCLNEFCKCKSVKPYPDVTCDNEEFKKLLLYNIGFLMETTFINISSYSNIEIAIFLSDYYYHIKNNILMSFSIVQSAFTLRNSKVNSVHILNMYYINQTFIEIFSERFRLCPDALHFTKIFEDISTKFDFYKSMIKYGNTFESLIDTKISFENSIKFEKDSETNELKSIYSILQKKEIIWETIEQLMLINKLTKDIKIMLKSPHCQKRGLEFYYIIYLFYLFFDKKIPTKLIRKFNELTIGESFIGLTQKETQVKFDKLLDKYLSRTSSINHIIIKCSKGLKIKYFSANLCNRLGFNQSSLVGEPFHSIFPKSMRESHTKAMFHLLMNNNSFSFHKKIVIFDANEHYIPAEVSVGVMPHLSKRLLLICEIQLQENKGLNLSFILDNNFNGISMSEDAENKYSISLNILKKADSELAEVFDINPKFIREKYADELAILSQFQTQMKLCTIESYSKMLFHYQENIESLNDKNDKKFKINNQSLEVNSIRKIIVPSIEKKFVSFTRVKSVITQNIIKALNKLSDSPTKEEKLKQLTGTVIGLRKTMTEITFHKLNKSKAKEITRESNIKPASIVIEFKVEMKTLYNIPIYYFKLKDKAQEYLSRNKFQNTYQINRTKTIEVNKKESSTLGNIIKKGISLKRVKDKANQTMLSKTKKEIGFIYLTILCSFVLSLYILIGEMINIQKIIASLGFLFIAHYQQDTLLNYESTLFTLTFELGKYSNMEVSGDNLFESFDFMSYALKNSLKFFFQSLDEYDKKLNENFYPYLQNQTFTKILLDWNPVSYQSDYISEIHYVIYESGMILKERNIELIRKDIEQIFFAKYKLNPSTLINSSFGTVIYFVSINIPLSLSGSIQKIIFEAKSKLEIYLKGNQNLILSLEIVCYVSNLLFYCFVILLLKKYNKQIIKLIITMFLDNTTKTRSSFKYRTENYSMKQKIKLLIQLIHNFNMENSAAMKALLRGDYQPINSSQNVLMNDANVSLSNGINTTNSNLNMTSSANITTHTNQTSHYYLNKPMENNLFKRVTSSTDNKKKIPSDNDIISNNQFINLLQRKCINIMNNYLIVIYCCIIVNFTISVLRFFNTLDYQSYSDDALIGFNSFTSFFMALPTFLNSFRNKIVQRNSNLNGYHNISEIFAQYEQNVINITSKDNFKQFPKSYNFWNQINIKTNDTSLDKATLCYNDTICIELLSEPNGMCADGIFLGYQLIIQKVIESFRDYEKITKDSPDFTEEDIKEKVMHKDFIKVQKYTEFVLHRIQSTYYLVFDSDYKQYAQAIANKTIYLNTSIFIIEICGIIIIILCIVTRISKRLYQIAFSSAKFNSAIYQYSQNDLS